MDEENLRRLAARPYEETLREIEFGRFDDLQRRFGIRRSKAYKLIQAGQIRSVSVKEKGARSCTAALTCLIVAGFH